MFTADNILTELERTPPIITIWHNCSRHPREYTNPNGTTWEYGGLSGISGMAHPDGVIAEWVRNVEGDGHAITTVSTKYGGWRPLQHDDATWCESGFKTYGSMAAYYENDVARTINDKLVLGRWWEDDVFEGRAHPNHALKYYAPALYEERYAAWRASFGDAS